jgi:hypothetical protein
MPAIRHAAVPLPVKPGSALRALRRRWVRRGARTLVTLVGGAVLLAVAVPAMAFAWGAVEARVDIERGRPQLLGFGRPDLNAPQIDEATGLRRRSQGCCIDPLSSLHARAYNQIMRNAAGREELSTLRHLMHSRDELAQSFVGGGHRLPNGGVVDLTPGVRIEGTRSPTLILGDLRRRRSASSFDPTNEDVDVAIDASGELIVFRIARHPTRCTVPPSDSSVPSFHYHTYDARTGEAIQRVPRW